MYKKGGRMVLVLVFPYFEICTDYCKDVRPREKYLCLEKRISVFSLPR